MMTGLNVPLRSLRTVSLLLALLSLCACSCWMSCKEEETTQITNIVAHDTTYRHDTTRIHTFDTTVIHAADIAWSSVVAPTSQGLVNVSCDGPNNITAVGAGGTIIHSVDSGKTWTIQTSNTTQDLYGVYVKGAFGAVVGTTAYSPAVVLTTSDAGITWTQQSFSDNSNELRGLCFLNPQLGFAVGTDLDGVAGHLYGTTDGGKSWAPVSIPAVAGLYGIHFANAQSGVASGKAGALLRTIDGGQTWTSVSYPGVAGFIRTVIPWPANAWLALGGPDDNSSNIFLRSDDGGASWHTVLGPNVPVYGGCAAAGDTAVIAGIGGLVGRSSDGGTTWDVSARGTGSWYNAAFWDGTDGVIVGSGGSILRASRAQ